MLVLNKISLSTSWATLLKNGAVHNLTLNIPFHSALCTVTVFDYHMVFDLRFFKRNNISEPNYPFKKQKKQKNKQTKTNKKQQQTK